ncbi:MAG: GNAT family N-acetyltransferase, partial [Bacteroidia bacterium]
MQIIEVNTQKDRKQFIDFPKWLYKDDPNWVCMLDSELEATFDAEKNNSFRQGEANRWILKDENGRTIGRIAAFFDKVRSSV